MERNAVLNCIKMRANLNFSLFLEFEGKIFYYFSVLFEKIFDVYENETTAIPFCNYPRTVFICL